MQTFATSDCFLLLLRSSGQVPHTILRAPVHVDGITRPGSPQLGDHVGERSSPSTLWTLVIRWISNGSEHHGSGIPMPTDTSSDKSSETTHPVISASTFLPESREPTFSLHHMRFEYVTKAHS